MKLADFFLKYVDLHLELNSKIFPIMPLYKFEIQKQQALMEFPAILKK
jgi:hypothetical protein